MKQPSLQDRHIYSSILSNPSKRNHEDCPREMGPRSLQWICGLGPRGLGFGFDGRGASCRRFSPYCTAASPLQPPARATHSAHAHTIVTFLICWCSFAQPEAAGAAPPPAKVGELRGPQSQSSHSRGATTSPNNQPTNLSSQLAPAMTCKVKSARRLSVAEW